MCLVNVLWAPTYFIYLGINLDMLPWVHRGRKVAQSGTESSLQDSHRSHGRLLGAARGPKSQSFCGIMMSGLKCKPSIYLEHACYYQGLSVFWCYATFVEGL